jgi:hypothetical protein
MRFRLRTLLIVLALAPPVLAGLWLAGVWLAQDGRIAILIPIACYAALVALAVNLKRIIRFVVSRMI